MNSLQLYRRAFRILFNLLLGALITLVELKYNFDVYSTFSPKICFFIESLLEEFLIGDKCYIIDVQYI